MVSQSKGANQTKFGIIGGILAILFFIWFFTNEPKPKNQNNNRTVTHICEVGGCNRTGLRSLIGFSGEMEYYCPQHHEELLKMLEIFE